MPNYTVKQISGGNYNGSGGNPTSGVGGAITALAGDTILIFCMSAREETAVHYHSVVSIDSSTQTFSKIINEDFTYVDATADPSFPDVAWHADVFKAVATGTLTAQSWSSTMTGSDTFVNQGYVTVMVISGLGDLDTNASNLGSNFNLTGTSSAIATDAISTDTGNPFLLQFILAHTAGSGTAPTLTVSDAGYITTVAGQGNTKFSPGGSGGASAATIGVFFQESLRGLLAHPVAGSSHGMWAAFNIAFAPPVTDNISTYSNRFSLGQRNTSSGGSGVVTAVNTNFEGEFGTLWSQTVDGVLNSGPVQTNTPTVDSSYVEWVFDQAFICTALLAVGGDNNNYGVWKVYGSNDGTTYDLLGSVTWTNVANGAAVFVNQDQDLNGCEMAFTNTTAYNRYKIIYHSSFGAAGRYCYEMLFKRNQSKFNGGPRKTLITGTTNMTESHGRTGLGDLLDDDFRPWHASVGENLYNSLSVNDFFKFQFSSAVIMNDVLVMCGMNTNISTFGTWKWQRSSDNSTWTDVGSPFLFNVDGVNHDQCLVLPDPGGTTAAIYWRMLCTNATKTNSVFLYEFIFNAEGAPPTSDGNASGVTKTVTASLSPAGHATVPGISNGATKTVTVSLTAGHAFERIDVSTSGHSFTVGTSLAKVGAAAGSAIDGTKIFEVTFSGTATSRYQEADYDSMYSRGRRIQNGLITAGESPGWSHIFAPMSQAFDGNYGGVGGDGPVPDNGTGNIGQSMFFSTGDRSLDIRAFTFAGGHQLVPGDQGPWTFKGGFGPGLIVPDSYTTSFDAFVPSQGPGTLPGTAGTSIYAQEFVTTPKLGDVYRYWEMQWISGLRNEGRVCEEMLLKVSHSNLDGGDRRSTNGRPEKQVVFTMSTHFVSFISGSFIAAADALFDGIYFNDSSFDNSKTNHVARIGAPSTFAAVSTVGAYLQFEFPRPVFFKRLMLSIDSGADQEAYTSGAPTKYGKWHWEYSKNSGSTWAAAAESWSFMEGVDDMLAPRAGNVDFAFDFTDAGIGPNGVTHWRMVLEAGPAFGPQTLGQFVFDLFDVTGLAPTFTVHFDDDVDGAPIVFVPGSPGSPYVVGFTDGSDDAFNGTFTNIPNPVLTVAFTDSGQFDTFSDLYPSMVVQTIVNATGR